MSEAAPVHIVALSGGADSTAMALWLAEQNPCVEYRYLCTPTGNELPEMAAHLDKLEGILGRPLERIARWSLEEGVKVNGCLPSLQRRWCTRQLKIEPCLQYMAALVREGLQPWLYVGLRADEPMRQGLYSDSALTLFPLREAGWNRAKVIRFLAARNITIPERTDCAVCPAQRIYEWHRLWKHYPDLYQRGVAMEAAISAKRGLPTTIRSRSRDTWPADLVGLAEEFESGRPIPNEGKYRQMVLPLDDVDMPGGRCRVCSL